ncbi:hypothetical protein [Sphingosinicella terrae]|uniref:hypothetical protein n=1 Tax=Sphingosinicella terrae TaxID=2172047 RepID=UPI000E0DE3FB|nr:hypothetical protein [Sphingosinicella terrae]
MSHQHESSPEDGGWSGRRLADADPGLNLRPAWRLADPAIEADAIAFWHRLNLLPPRTGADERVRQLAAAAYRDGRLIAVATVYLEYFAQLRGNFAWYRCAVDPEHRRDLASTAITVFTRDVLERWSAENPEEAVLGLAAVIESRALADRRRDPVWANTGLNLVGHNVRGEQIRVAWFAHARVE